VLARLVEDVALGLQVINGGANPASEPPRPLADHTTVDIGKLRVGVCDTDTVLAPCPAAKRAVQEAASALKAAGANVFAWQLPRVDEALALYYGALTAGGRLYKDILGSNKADPSIKTLLQFAMMSHAGAKRMAAFLRLIGQRNLAAGVTNFGYRSTEEYWELVDRAHAYRAAFAAAMDQANRMDLILLPGTALPALTHGAGNDLGTIGAYTILFNLLGLPAGIVPVTRVQANEESERPKTGDRMEAAARKVELGSAGMPISVQLVGRLWREHTVLAAMKVVEANARTSTTFPERPPL
jgi:fatty acid amide hydrolase